MNLLKSMFAVFALVLGMRLAIPDNLTAQEKPQPVRVILIGDSTVKNGRGQGEDGLWGWGQVLQDHFNPEQATVENRALGGRSSRTYRTEGLWEKTLERLRPGDFLLIQFGHNDGGKMFEGDRPRASIKGNGEETQTGVVEATGREETVHSYGWYLRRYIAEAKARKAIPIVCSLVPRDRWQDGKVIRSNQDYALWARQAARQGGAAFLDLNEIVARRYEQLGETFVGRELFTETDWTHTTKAGAVWNARCVVEGIRQLDVPILKDALLPESPSDRPPLDFDDSQTTLQDRISPRPAIIARQSVGS